MIRGLLLLLVTAALPSSMNPQQSNPSEYELKAVFLYRITQFVDWPDHPPEASPAPVSMCILGRDPFGSALTDIFAQKRSDNHPMILRHLERGAGFKSCQVLYISSSERGALPQIFESLKGARVLTIGESDRFAESGGVIRMTLEEKRLRLEVNTEAARQAGIKLSSKLLSLAHIVTPR